MFLWFLSNALLSTTNQTVFTFYCVCCLKHILNIATVNRGYWACEVILKSYMLSHIFYLDFLSGGKWEWWGENVHIETFTKIKCKRTVFNCFITRLFDWFVGHGCIYPWCCLSAWALKRLGLGFKGFKRHVKTSLHESVAPE